MAQPGSEPDLIRLVNLDAIITRNTQLLAATKLRVEDGLSDPERLCRYEELIVLQTRLIFERELLRSLLIGISDVPGCLDQPLPKPRRSWLSTTRWFSLRGRFNRARDKRRAKRASRLASL
jgi:hypothetical protein